MTESLVPTLLLLKKINLITKSSEDATNPFENEDFSDDDRTFDPKRDANMSNSNSEVDENLIRG